MREELEKRAPDSRSGVKVRNIWVDFTRSPDVKFSNHISQKRVDYLEWIEIEVEFAVYFPPDIDVLDELTFEYSFEFHDRLCLGRVTHVDLPFDGSLYSVIYLSPSSVVSHKYLV